MKNDPKIAAAVAAVFHYIQSEEEAACMQAQTGAGAWAPRASAGPLPSLWAASGRQEMMQMRGMMQMKAFHRLGRG